MLTPKNEWEREIFGALAAAAGLVPDHGSVTSGVPPQPDIRYTVVGVEQWADLVEITDEDLAEKHMTSLKTMTITGGAFSQRAPLERSIRMKASKTYQTHGSRLDLVAYYDKQFPAISVEPDLIPDLFGPVAREMVASGVWTKVWVYDRWSNQILWCHPG